MRPVVLYSFGLSYGRPTIKFDVFYDVRHLKDMWKEAKNTQRFLGTDKKMQKKFFQVPDIEDFYETVIFEPLQARMRSEEEEDHASTKKFRVGIACHFGQHKSVMIVERLASELAEEFPNFEIRIKHLTIDGPPY